MTVPRSTLPRAAPPITAHGQKPAGHPPVHGDDPLRSQPGGFAGAGVAPTGLGLVERRGKHGEPARGLITPGRAAGGGRGVGDQVGAAGAGVGDGDERRRE